MNDRALPGQCADSAQAQSTRITREDLPAVATVLSLGMVSWLTSINSLRPIARTIGRGTGFWHGGNTGPPAKFVSGLRAAYNEPSAALDIHRQYQNLRREVRLLILALNRPGRHWQPIVRCKGLDHLQSSIERGSGTILWVSGFAFTEILTLVALQQAGFTIDQLVRPEHGFSSSPFGIRWLNPLWTRIERRYGAKQIVIQNNDAGAALRFIRDRLAVNGIVWISVGPEARRMLHVPFLRGALTLATAPLHLARTSRASVLPVFTIRASDGTYDVTFERPLDVDSDTTYAGAARSYAAMLEQYVAVHPEQWRGWESLIAAPTPAGHG